ncbi:NAD/NADP octopine/nopaline dehydrogenase family protein [Falsiroseomonas tokyonensis]|uniref:NAD/NADP octopine/nopaline dehydrogenase family protein n=1 Tax=Falsiroseomonas tokyonensis TaxID=430521 RepID=A0ABV7BQB3_9PROT|nr:NAD/NADP octopine/nopaline dehydrogenase family protein [Falsiroseomonas tokyonensis]MBU8536849.1 NAD/NADP octopine/nopaline dehydrogenase family protein [Falsiroseomonas tokyonensis]
MRLAVLGAGAVGPGAAALAVSRGHRAALWSPRGGGTHGIGSSLAVQGVISGTARVDVAVDVARALAGADAVLVSVPPHALGPVLRRIVPMLAEGVPVLLAPSHSLAPLLLDRLLARAGRRAPIGALATPPVVAERLSGDELRILALPERVELASIPAAAAEPLARLCTDLFGMDFLPLGDALGTALAAHEPVLQAALALGNVTRIEAGEDWDQHGRMTPAICRLAERLDAERLALATAYGHAVPSLAAALHRRGGVPQGPLPVMARALAAARPTPGLRGLDVAQLAVSVTYGLALWLRLGAARGLPMPMTQAAVAVLEAMTGSSLSADDLLEGLDLQKLPALLRDGHAR